MPHIFHEHFRSFLKYLYERSFCDFAERLDWRTNCIIFARKEFCEFLKNNQNVTNYLEPILSNGFLPINSKATRIQGASFSLIDHVITNINPEYLGTTGTIIADVSDHYICKFH